MTFDLDTVAKVAEVVGCVMAIVAAVEAWRGHTESKNSHDLLKQVRIEVNAKQTQNVIINNSQTSGPPTVGV